MLVCVLFSYAKVTAVVTRVIVGLLYMDQQLRRHRLGHHHPCYPAEPEPNVIDLFY